MKKQFLLLSLCLLSMSVAQAKDINDTQLTQEQVQALHQQTISEFKSDFQVVLDNYNNYIDHNQEQVGLKGCLNNLDTQLKDDFNHYQWNSYQDIDISKIPLKVQSKLSTLSELSKDENNLNYYYYGKIFSIESKNEALLDEIAPQLFPYFLNTQLVKDQDFSKKTYIIKYVMIKNMSASEYNKMITLVNQQTNAAILCTNQYINHPDNNLYNNFILSLRPVKPCLSFAT